MKLLLDTCVWGGARKEIESAGYDVLWVGEWSKDPGDEEIFKHARNEGRIIVTLDKDFGELAIVYERPHYGILRLVNVPAKQQATVCLRVLALYGKELESGAIVTAEPGRMRIRPSNESTKEK